MILDIIKPLFKEIDVKINTLNVFEIFKNDDLPFFLDSGIKHKEIGRYSFIGSKPFLTFKSKGNCIQIKNSKETKNFTGDSFKELSSLLKKYNIKNNTKYPPFQGGIVGFFSYDMGRLIEDLPDTNDDDLNIPDCYLGFYDRGISIDCINNKIYVFATGLPFKNEQRIKKAKKDIQELQNKILKFKNNTKIKESSFIKNEKIKKHFESKEYCDVIQKTIDYIAAGDIFQANISQRFSVRLEVSPWDLYKKLRKINPAPFAAYLDFKELQIVSSSPERFIKISDSKIETRPIKGTRPRGRNKEEDLKLKNELINSEKDKSELVMIVDLERNDLGRVCNIGTVNVDELFRLEEYATVYHLVSTITGELKNGYNVVDTLKATFPGGSITGAPKIRAMEIIEELEPVKRGIYTGSIGYLGFNNQSDLNIVIRTFVIKNGRAYFQAGGGIVADSKPLDEYEETLHKAKALKQVLYSDGE